MTHTATPFTKENLIKDGEYLYYVPPGCGPYSDASKFVARFKYGRGGMGTFATFLRKNFTVEEFFAEMDKGTGPLAILEAKGYILPHIKKWLREGGYPVTRAGYDQLLADEIAARDARLATS
jgi:hypothetical protein